MLIAGVSTVLFNANPLLRFDGYYMLADCDGDSQSPHPRHPVSRLPVRVAAVRSAAAEFEASRGRAAWFVAFAVRSFFYRILVIMAIAIFLGEQSLLLGVIFALGCRRVRMADRSAGPRS